ncbi:MAG: hypothetical protein KAJ42_15455 [Gemmatimonadetes bacterium]|nr:hypothetical protein [Gemmatimonadota bacterium]
MNRDALYRDCALQAGLVQLANTDEHGRTFETDDVDRIPGGAWVTCQVYISNAEVSELLSRERKERRLEANICGGCGEPITDEQFIQGDSSSYHTTCPDAVQKAMLRELQDTPRRGDV